ncbi:hypothetical protein BV898_13289 [Hypsibius exemplaris]|uniref:Uncharacterized protein n=1 Tax=Hypsibius exemplaris TaxID=2072580 RepID=A0A1W0WB76_HYPEX|nr:hypothetical protein BV898_13289 [Hypsibius exemplaris]
MKKEYRYWTSARFSVSLADVTKITDEDFWEEHFSVLPWVWKDEPVRMDKKVPHPVIGLLEALTNTYYCYVALIDRLTNLFSFCVTFSSFF